MRHIARTSLGLLALGLIAPITVSAQTVDTSTPSGYQPAVAGLPSAATPAPAPALASGPVHIHDGKTLCAACAAKQANHQMPPGKFVGCRHSNNGVCSACKAALDMPGTWVQGGGAPAEAPGRAVAASAAPTPARASGYEAAMGDPAPVGVIQAGYSQSAGTMPMQAPMMNPAGMQSATPGRAVAESKPGRDLLAPKSNGGFPHPHIIGHLLGWSGIGSERRQEKAAKKAETHAMLTYDPNAPTGVSELPASAVFGKQK